MAKKYQTQQKRRIPKDDEVDLVCRNILLYGKELDKIYNAIADNNWQYIEDNKLRQIEQDRQTNMLQQFSKLNSDYMEQVGIMEIFLLGEAKSGNMRAGTFINGFWQYMNKRKGT